MNATTLTVKKFKHKNLDDPRLQGFRCGRHPCQSHMATWIRNRVELLQALHGWKIFIFETDDGKLVGYGSVNRTEMILPSEYGYGTEQEKIMAIPTLAVQEDFWGKPNGTGDVKFSRQIMDFLIERAKSWRENSETGDIRPCLALAVHPLNRRARGLYTECGFQELPPNPNDRLLYCPVTNVELVRMVRII